VHIAHRLNTGELTDVKGWPTGFLSNPVVENKILGQQTTDEENN
jgi:hypothetical protein